MAGQLDTESLTAATNSTFMRKTFVLCWWNDVGMGLVSSFLFPCFKSYTAKKMNETKTINVRFAKNL